MSKRRIFTDRTYTHFVTFSCYKRRQLLQSDRCKKIVISILDEEVGRHQGCCIGFVIMHNHVHALVWFPDRLSISSFMERWKGHSSQCIQEFYEKHFPAYWSKIDDRNVWQPRYYDFNVESTEKVEQKLDYMHANPVRAGLVKRAEDWPYSSARYYSLSQSVGIAISSPPGTFD